MQCTCVLQYFCSKTVCYCIVKLIKLFYFILVVLFLSLLLLMLVNKDYIYRLLEFKVVEHILQVWPIVSSIPFSLRKI